MHALTASLHYLADATDAAHLAKLKSEMEKAEADVQLAKRAQARAATDMVFGSGSAYALAALDAAHRVTAKALKVAAAAKAAYEAALAASK